MTRLLTPSQRLAMRRRACTSPSAPVTRPHSPDCNADCMAWHRMPVRHSNPPAHIEICLAGFNAADAVRNWYVLQGRTDMPCKFCVPISPAAPKPEEPK